MLTVVFLCFFFLLPHQSELYWVPGCLIQAEDVSEFLLFYQFLKNGCLQCSFFSSFFQRIHRISQTEKCDIYYLLGTETLDTYVHPSLCKKLATLDSIVDKRTDRTFKGATTTTVPAEEEEESLLKIISGLF